MLIAPFSLFAGLIKRHGRFFSPCGFDLEEEGLSWMSAYEDQAAKNDGNEKTVHAPMLLFARQVIRCGVSAKVLLKATLSSGSRLGCFTYGWLTLLEFMVQFMWIVVLSCQPEWPS